MFKFLRLIVRFSAEPVTVIHPIPLVPVTISLIAKTGSSTGAVDVAIGAILSVAYASSLLSAANLWNHLNDAEVDVIFGRKSEDLLKNRKLVLVVVLVFYCIASGLVLIFAKSSLVTFLHFYVVTVLWLYSDRLLLGKILKFRLKEHYITETLTYLTVLPCGSLIIWGINAKINSTALFVSLLVTLFSFSVAVLKDLKDISADEYAGYRTLGVVVSPVKLLKLSFFVSAIYFVLLITFIAVKFSTTLTLIPLAALFLCFLYIYATLSRRGWRIGREIERTLKLYPLVLVLSMFLLFFSAAESLLG